MEIKKNSELRFKYVMNIDAQVLSYFCKAFVKRILKIYLENYHRYRHKSNKSRIFIFNERLALGIFIW